MITKEIERLCEESSMSESNFYMFLRAIADEKLEEGSFRDYYDEAINDETSDVLARLGFKSMNGKVVHPDINDVDPNFVKPHFNFEGVPADRIPYKIFREGLDIGERALRDEFRELLRIRR